MIFLALGFITYAIGALLSRRPAYAYGAAAIASLSLLVAAVGGLTGFERSAAVTFVGTLQIGVGIDHLTGVFLAISALVWLFVSIFGVRYGRTFRGLTAVGFNLALAGMTLVLTAIDAITFLFGWEIMTVFVFLMLFERSASERSPFVFLALGELSTVLLVLAVALLYAFDHTISLGARGIRGSVFVLAALGMIIKMDIVPFHGWMRRAYEQLPGHVAAIASVSVTMMGVYGIERLASSAAFVPWWAITLLLMGALSAFWGALQAVGTNGLRLVPAYSTVESNGMILAAIALSIIAGAESGAGLAYLAAFAQAAALVLVVSHALAKSLLFLSIGEGGDALKATTISEARALRATAGPVPALGILVAGLSFAAFPPLVGYVGEWMLLETTFQAYKFTAFAVRFATSFAGILIALAIGLAAFAFVRLIGYASLGGERRLFTRPAGSAWLAAPQIALAALVLLAGVGLPALLNLFGFGTMLGGLLDVPKPLLLVSGNPVFGVVSPTMFAVVVAALGAIPAWAWFARRRNVRVADAWNGGIETNQVEAFSAPAYSQILTNILRIFLRTREVTDDSGRRVVTVDVFESWYLRVAAALVRIGRAVSRTFMSGRIAAYVLYILIMFVIALVAATI